MATPLVGLWDIIYRPIEQGVWVTLLGAELLARPRWIHAPLRERRITAAIPKGQSLGSGGSASSFLAARDGLGQIDEQIHQISSESSGSFRSEGQQGNSSRSIIHRGRM